MCDRATELTKHIIIKVITLQVPGAQANVTVNERILMDVSPPELFGINVVSGGSLVWSPDVEINLVLRYIIVYGEVHIGSESCKFAGKTKITLKGHTLLIVTRNMYFESFFN